MGVRYAPCLYNLSRKLRRLRVRVLSWLVMTHPPPELAFGAGQPGTQPNCRYNPMFENRSALAQLASTNLFKNHHSNVSTQTQHHRVNPIHISKEM